MKISKLQRVLYYKREKIIELKLSTIYPNMLLLGSAQPISLELDTYWISTISWIRYAYDSIWIDLIRLESTIWLTQKVSILNVLILISFILI